MLGAVLNSKATARPWTLDHPRQTSHIVVLIIPIEDPIIPSSTGCEEWCVMAYYAAVDSISQNSMHDELLMTGGQLNLVKIS